MHLQAPRLRSLCPPPPEGEGSLLLKAHERPLVASHWPIVEGDLEQYRLDADHDDRLYEKRIVVMGTWPVEKFQYRSREHDQRDIKREAGGCFGAVDGENLIRIRSDWGKYQTTRSSEEHEQELNHSTYKRGANAEIMEERNAMMRIGRLDRYGGPGPTIGLAESYWTFNRRHHRRPSIEVIEAAVTI